jgi:hypothetical protein
MKSPLFVLAILALSASAMADVGPGQLLACKGSNGSTFEIHRTAAARLYQGTLLSDGQDAAFNCVRNDTSEHKVEWSCSEPGSIDGGLIFAAYASEVTAKRLGKLSARQIFPLKPQLIEAFVCN